MPTGIAGRVGNKGGVGVSINISGRTILFVNAHLAGLSQNFRSKDNLTDATAHEDRLLDRINDMAKIKVLIVCIPSVNELTNLP